MGEHSRHQALIVAYAQGAITQKTLVLELVQLITDQSVQQILQDAPPPVVALLREEVATAPQTDHDWAAFCIISDSCTLASVEEQRTEAAEIVRRFGHGIETLNRYLPEIAT